MNENTLKFNELSTGQILRTTLGIGSLRPTMDLTPGYIADIERVENYYSDLAGMMYTMYNVSMTIEAMLEIWRVVLSHCH
jgi:hypothetical protein